MRRLRNLIELAWSGDDDVDQPFVVARSVWPEGIRCVQISEYLFNDFYIAQVVARVWALQGANRLHCPKSTKENMLLCSCSVQWSVESDRPACRAFQILAEWGMIIFQLPEKTSNRHKFPTEAISAVDAYMFVSFLRPRARQIYSSVLPRSDDEH
jgi:hypothetical protein